MRLNKYIAQAGICSRRKADELTEAGKVKINGAVCRQLGYDVQDGDVVVVNGQTIGKPEKHVYYMLNKPVGYITTNDDEKGRPTATSLLTDVTARVFPVGRLDANTSGLLILTNDGEFANAVAHPSHRIEKTYIAVVNDHVSSDALWDLRNGVAIVPPERSMGAKSPLLADISRRMEELRREFASGGIHLKSLRAKTLCDCL